MRLLFDQNISHRILKILSDEFSGSTLVKSENLIDSSDKTIWEFAKKSNYIIVTQDSDFNDLNSLYGFPPKIIWIRTGNLKTEELAKILKIHFSEIQEFENNPSFGCFEILTIKK
ncbi:DUF5615 family PIN-like protein [Flavobacterium caeni]|uniref:Predicted nuclease, contains PIN domain, potential toxin-antitoxin system component n=1 Tax=Flavobacterium caeni TaxID=490189 RepID=A0A1G5BAI0_9FLAO|nr:DUF5615 family PIN-like protein [Flavobacterium caeni]SCX87106.1 Predicted nuclease, contains PIN domain, potential toxin-antitoxin system component [Flavobacterium caeni]